MQRREVLGRFDAFASNYYLERLIDDITRPRIARLGR